MKEEQKSLSPVAAPRLVVPSSFIGDDDAKRLSRYTNSWEYMIREGDVWKLGIVLGKDVVEANRAISSLGVKKTERWYVNRLLKNLKSYCRILLVKLVNHPVACRDPKRKRLTDLLAPDVVLATEVELLPGAELREGNLLVTDDVGSQEGHAIADLDAAHGDSLFLYNSVSVQCWRLGIWIAPASVKVTDFIQLMFSKIRLCLGCCDFSDGVEVGRPVTTDIEFRSLGIFGT